MPTPKGWVPGEILVNFKKNISEEQMATMLFEFGLEIVSLPESPGGMYWIHVPHGDEEAWVMRLKKLEEIDSVNPNRRMELQ
ncbi:MAG: hypothetical protein HYW88_03445 [Candidatus Sungbacteria bacterium]|nr:hypothetical protein [Candidatus Sungbacteria bacterium]